MSFSHHCKWNNRKSNHRKPGTVRFVKFMFYTCACLFVCACVCVRACVCVFVRVCVRDLVG